LAAGRGDSGSGADAGVGAARGGPLPILPSTQLRAGDRVFTGAGARLLIKLAEGSVVKRGEAQALGDSLRGKFGITEPRTSG